MGRLPKPGQSPANRLQPTEVVSINKPIPLSEDYDIAMTNNIHRAWRVDVTVADGQGGQRSRKLAMTIVRYSPFSGPPGDRDAPNANTNYLLVSEVCLGREQRERSAR